MGTNYYLYQKPDCEACGRPFDRLHIGKSSGGWCFSLHVMPEEGIDTLDDWRSLWADPGVRIQTEYGKTIGASEMEAIITKRRRDSPLDSPEWWQGYYGSEDDFHQKNHSMRGPNNLLRHKLGHGCIAHGDGPWDCIVGEFS